MFRRDKSRIMDARNTRAVLSRDLARMNLSEFAIILNLVER